MKTRRFLGIVSILALFAMLATPVLAQTYVPSGSYSPYAYSPWKDQWVTGHPKNYAEGETTVNLVEITGMSGSTNVQMDLCLQVVDGSDNTKTAFFEFRPWETTYTIADFGPNWPNGQPIGTVPLDASGLFGQSGLTITSVSGPSTTMCSTAGYLGYRVIFDVTAAAAYLTYGGVLSYPGALNPVTGNVVQPGTSASSILGVFQTRVASSGEKTINYSGTEVIGNADVEITKTCDAYTSEWQRYAISVRNLGPAVAYGLVVTDTLPTGTVLGSYAITSRLYTSASSYTDMAACNVSGLTVTCALATPNATNFKSLFEVSGGFPRWEIVIRFSYSPPSPNTATVTAQTPDIITSNNSGQVICTVPSAVELVSFSATGGKSSIDLAWATATELNNVGFNLYRAESAGGDRVRLNNELIPARAIGTPSGASYGYSDASVSQGVTYYYWLEDVELNGASAMHGPVSAQMVAQERPTRELPVMPIAEPARPEPVVIMPVQQMPLIVVPGSPVPVQGAGQLLPAPVVGPVFRGLPVEGGLR